MVLRCTLIGAEGQCHVLAILDRWVCSPLICVSMSTVNDNIHVCIRTLVHVCVGVLHTYTPTRLHVPHVSHLHSYT